MYLAGVLTSALARAQLQLDILVGRVRFNKKTEGKKHHVRNVWEVKPCIRLHVMRSVHPTRLSRQTACGRLHCILTAQT